MLMRLREYDEIDWSRASIDGTSVPSPGGQETGHNPTDCRAYLMPRGIVSRIARRGVESSEKLSKHRRGVERMHGWFAGFGKLRIRFEGWTSTKHC